LPASHHILDSTAFSTVVLVGSGRSGKKVMPIKHRQLSAVIYTLLGSYRRHGGNLFDYLKDLFTRLPAAKITQIKEFTPTVWASAKAIDKIFAQAA